MTARLTRPLGRYGVGAEDCGAQRTPAAPEAEPRGEAPPRGPERVSEPLGGPDAPSASRRSTSRLLGIAQEAGTGTVGASSTSSRYSCSSAWSTRSSLRVRLHELDPDSGCPLFSLHPGASRCPFRQVGVWVPSLCLRCGVTSDSVLVAKNRKSPRRLLLGDFHFRHAGGPVSLRRPPHSRQRACRSLFPTVPPGIPPERGPLRRVHLAGMRG